jgi:hypothetical protein
VLIDASCFENRGKKLKNFAECVEKSRINTRVIFVNNLLLGRYHLPVLGLYRGMCRFVLPIMDVRAGTSSRENS